MNSEKVKEIKKALECCSISCTDCPYDKGETTNPICINNLAKNALTLINELESENKRLSDTEIGELIKENEELAKQCVGWVEIYRKRKEENQQLKDRIVLLEKDNELLRNAKVVYENVDYCYEDLKKAEKKIAELEKEVETRKEEVLHLQEYGKKLIRETELKQFAERLKEKVIRPCDLYDCVTVDDIDETLKEFIDGNTN